MSDTVEIKDVIELLSILADESNLKVTFKESLKGGLLTGLATLAGGLFGGKNGLLLGAAIGGITAYAATANFEGVGSVLLKMDDMNKQKLYEKAKDIFSKISVTDIKSMHVAVTDPDIRDKLLKAIVNHVEEQLHMDIVE